MEKTRLVVETRECICTCECDNGCIDASPGMGIAVNSVGEHCLKQGSNKDDVCSFLKWIYKREVEIESFELIDGNEYAKIRKNW